MAIPSEVDIITYKVIQPRVIQDNFFLASAFWAAMRRKGRFIPFGGGSYIASPFLYRGLQANAYRPGDEFFPERRNIISQFVLNPKFYIGFAVEQLEDLEVHVKGPNTVFSLIRMDLAALVLSMTSTIAVAFHKHGQNVSGDDRSQHINGWVEALNDGVSPSYDGRAYASYGGQTRSEVGNVLNSIPFYNGTATGQTQPLSYARFNEEYLKASFGQMQPDLILSSKGVISDLESQMQRQQVYVQASDPWYGLYSGIKHKKAIVLHDDLWPSLRYGQNAEYGDFTTSSFTFASAGVPSSFAAEMPSNGTSLNVGEVMVMFNTDTWDVILSDSKLFSFGWTGWETAQTNTRAVGKMPAAINLRNNGNRYNRQIFGIS